MKLVILLAIEIKPSESHMEKKMRPHGVRISSFHGGLSHATLVSLMNKVRVLCYCDEHQHVLITGHHRTFSCMWISIQLPSLATLVACPSWSSATASPFLFLRPFILRVCSLDKSCFCMCTRPNLVPKASWEMFFFLLACKIENERHLRLVRDALLLVI